MLVSHHDEWPAHLVGGRQFVCQVDLVRYPQFTTKNLAAHSFRQVIHDLDDAWILVCCKPFLAELDQILGGRLGTVLEGHEGLHGFAAIRIHDTDDSSLSYGRVFVENIFHFAWPHFETRGIYLILHPVDDVKPTVAVHESDVAGVKTPVRHGMCGLVRLVPVSECNLGAGAHAPAVLPDLYRLVVLVHHLGVRIRYRHADSNGPRRRIYRRFTRIRHHDCRAVRLGQPVAVVNVVTELRPERFH